MLSRKHFLFTGLRLEYRKKKMGLHQIITMILKRLQRTIFIETTRRFKHNKTIYDDK